MMPTASEIVAKGRELLGVAWGHQGRMHADRRVDCGGLWVYVGRELGLEVHDVEGYGRAPVGRGLDDVMARHFQRIPVADIRPADAVLIRFPLAGKPSHVAMITDRYHLPPWHGLGLLHALNGHRDRGRVIEQALGKVWRSRIASAWRLPHLAG